MSDLVQALYYMAIGMGVVFGFLAILIGYMKLVPIISKKKGLFKFGSSRNKFKSVPDPKSPSPSTGSNGKLKLNSVLNQISSPTASDHPADTPNGTTIAAIAAAIYSHTGKKPGRIVITAPSGAQQEINLWGVAGRQDIMLSRDITGQVGFQY